MKKLRVIYSPTEKNRSTTAGSIQKLEFGIWSSQMTNHTKESYVKTPNKKVSRYLFAEQKILQKFSAKAKFLWKFSEAGGGRRSIF
jgi:hypothetical protein